MIAWFFYLYLKLKGRQAGTLQPAYRHIASCFFYHYIVYSLHTDFGTKTILSAAC